MRVLIHTEEYAPTPAACAYRMRSLAEGLSRRGHSVTVITSSRNRADGSMPAGKERVLYAPAIRMKKKTKLSRLLGQVSFGLSSLVTAARAGRADAVIVTSPPLLSAPFGRFIARIKGAKWVYDVRDLWPDVAVEMGSWRETGLPARLFRRIDRRLCRQADLITAVTPGKAEKLRARMGDEGRKVRLAENGFDEAILRQPIDDTLIRRYDLKHGMTCVYIGNIGLAQGLDALLHIARHTRHRDARFLLFGDGADRARLEEQAQRAGLRSVQFCGPIPHEGVRTLLSCATLTFIPLRSGRMRDSIPTKVYEALGVGCPVLLAAEGDAAALLAEAGLGQAVPPEDRAGLTAAFDRMAERPEQFDPLRERARALMLRDHSRQKIADRFAEEIEALMD